MSGSRVDWPVEGARGDHKITLLFVGRVLGKVRLYGERERGGRGGRQRQGKKRFPTRKYKITKEDIKIIGGGCRLLRPSTHPHPQVLPAAQVGRGKPSSIGTLGRQTGAARYRLTVSWEADGRTTGDHRIWWWRAN